jgi:diguanylate cyclase (GGDEF)-like protein
LGSHDLAGRVGGEEFAVLVWGDAEAGAALAERMRASVAAEPFAARGVATPLGITASFGVASFPLDALTVGALREAADAALYAAKRGGRNTVRVFTTANDGSAYIAKGE